MKRQMKNILTGSSILLLGFGISIFFSGHANCQSQSVFPSELQEEDRSERRWIKKRPPSNRKIKVFVDGQRAATIYPHQRNQDRSGNVYIRSDKARRWIKKQPPSNRKVKVFVDGQHAITIYPHQWHRDSSGNVYIRSDKTRRWIRDED